MRLKNWPNTTLYAAAVSDRSENIKLIRSPYFAENTIKESVKSTIIPEALNRHRGRRTEHFERHAGA